MNNQKGFARYNSISGFAHMLPLLLVVALIGLGGWWMWKNDKLNIAVEDPTPTPTLTEPIVEATDDWKTYKDIELGFAIKFPHDIFSDPKVNTNTTDKSYEVVFEYCPEKAQGFKDCGAPGYDFMRIRAENNINNLTLEEKSQNQFAFKPPECVLKSTDIKKKINFKNLDAIVYEYFVNEETRREKCPPQSVGFDNNKTIVAVKDDQIYTIAISNASDESYEIFNQILSTFEFLDATITEQEKKLIDNWIEENDLNNVGDPKNSLYPGGTPLYNEFTGKRIDRYEYIIGKHPDKPWDN